MRRLRGRSRYADIARAYAPRHSAGAGQARVSKKAPMQRTKAATNIRMIAVDKPGTAATIASGWHRQHLRWNPSCSATQARRRAAPKKPQGPGSCHIDHLCTTRMRCAQRRSRPCSATRYSGRPQFDRIEKELMMAGKQGDHHDVFDHRRRTSVRSASCRSRSSG